jgi:phosphomannomutase
MDKKLPPKFERAFKDADIRGITGAELDDDVAYLVARAFVDEFAYTKLVVGYDMRVSTPSLVEGFIAGARDAGADVVDVGLVPSTVLYYASGAMDLPGVMVTASHSPAEYNGLKLVAPGAVPLTKATGLSALLKRVKGGMFKEPKRRGKRLVKNVRPGYAKYVLKGMKKQSCAGLRLAADIGNGMASVMMPLIDEQLPIDFSYLFADLDGRFPNRGSDPTIRKHQKYLVKELQASQYDFGIAFDGDADRIAFLDEKGKYVNCAVIGALIAEHILEREPGAGIVFTNLTSRVFEESIKAAGGKPVRARVGHAFLKRKLRDTGAAFGAEHSGHFFWRDFFNTDSVILTLRAVIEIYATAKKEGKTFSELVKPYQRYQQLEDVVIDVEDKVGSLNKVEAYIKQTWPMVRVKKFDGLFVDTVWGAEKPSVTEHALKVMFEGSQQAAAKAIQTELVDYIRSIAQS